MNFDVIKVQVSESIFSGICTYFFAILYYVLYGGGGCVNIMDELFTIYYIDMEDGYLGLFVNSIFVLVFAFNDIDIL